MRIVVLWMMGCGAGPDVDAPVDGVDPVDTPTDPSDDPSPDPVSDTAPEVTPDEGPCPGVPLSLDYGTATDNWDFVPVIQVTHTRIQGGGAQAFYHVWSSALLSGTLQNVRLDTQVVDVVSGAVVSSNTLFRGLVPTLEGPWVCDGRAPGIANQLDFSAVDPRANKDIGWWAICGREVELRVTVVDYLTGEAMISDSCRVIVDPPDGVEVCPGPPQ